jgi:iron complex outermembrane recepter protein
MAIRNALCVSAAVLALTVSSMSCAQAGAERDFDITAQDLKYALRDLARQAGLELVATSEALEGRQAPALHGRYTAREALNLLLSGSKLSADISEGAIVIRGRSEPPVAADKSELSGSPEIVVTGTRLRGVELASPVIVASQHDIRRGGITNLGDYARSLPQSFGGGQNPGVTVGVLGDNNENVSSASSINLRGLGPDATLTLLNGRRLAYNSAVQAIDISAIPLSAVDRVEVITDGASAIYGSDAVAGVANVILKRSYNGLLASSRFGVSTDGGDSQQQYSLLGGLTGSKAGFLAVYDFERDMAITAKSRSYTSGSFPPTTLLPSQRHHSGLITGYWNVTDAMVLSVDALYSSRSSLTIQPLASNDYTALGYRREPKVRSYALSPNMEWTIFGTWKLSAFGTFTADKTILNTRLFSAGILSFASLGSYRNSSAIGEANLEGRLLELPAGAVRLALGAGYRSIKLDADLRTVRPSGSVPSVAISERRNSRYAFGELFVPLLSPEQGVTAVDRLSLTGAARYEGYSNNDVVTPKVGLIYAPVHAIEFKASWGKSFKTPTLYQQYSGYTAQLVPVSYFGASGYPSNATALFLSGGNAQLRPERATTWTTSVEFRPAQIEGLTSTVTFFHVRYKNRISQPITSYEGLLSSAVYRDLVTLSPSISSTQSAISGATSGLQNQTGSPFNPSTVAAIIDSRYLNISTQVIKGVDFIINYRVHLNSRDALTFQGNASYLKGNRQLTPTASDITTAGIIFNPPHWRGRAGVAWEGGPLTVAAYGNYVGPVLDNRASPTVNVRGLTTGDLTAAYQTSQSSGILSNVELALSVLNIFNGKPDRVRTSSPFYPAFDSTNYSSVGRFISFSVQKKF